MIAKDFEVVPVGTMDELKQLRVRVKELEESIDVDRPASRIMDGRSRRHVKKAPKR